jgi:hypothetical protein
MKKINVFLVLLFLLLLVGCNVKKVKTDSDGSQPVAIITPLPLPESKVENHQKTIVKLREDWSKLQKQLSEKKLTWESEVLAGQNISHLEVCVLYNDFILLKDFVSIMKNFGVSSKDLGIEQTDIEPDEFLRIKGKALAENLRDLKSPITNSKTTCYQEFAINLDVSDNLMYVLKTANLNPVDVGLTSTAIRERFKSGFREVAQAWKQGKQDFPLFGERTEGTEIQRAVADFGFTASDLGLTAEELEKALSD